jgi:PadR family transcriptional regulator PadR
MLENSTNSQLKRGLLDLFVLLTLYQKSLYPSEIIENLKTSGINMPEGTLYPLLNRLKNDQYLTYKWEESTGGPPRKYFQITDSGKVLIQEKLSLVQELFESLKQICQLNSIKF